VGLTRSAMTAEQADMLFVGDADAHEKVMSLLGPARRPDAIVTSSDRLAAVVYGVAAELGLRIGHDLAVTGFDGSIAAELMHPRLTSVAIPVDDIAKRVVARALRQVEQEPDQAPGEVVPTTLRLGESTGERLDERIDERLDGRLGESAGDEGGTVRPGRAAATLVRGTPRTVAIIVAHLTRPSTVVRVASALTVLEEQGYDPIVFNVNTPPERDRHLEALMPTHRADGVLAICLPFTREQLDQFSRAGVALVSVDAVNPGVPQTVIDDVAGGRLAALVWCRMRSPRLKIRLSWRRSTVRHVSPTVLYFTSDDLPLGESSSLHLGHCDIHRGRVTGLGSGLRGLQPYTITRSFAP
jgi:DNA-binding LacI/PurR family transcriptional regulator